MRIAPIAAVTAVVAAAALALAGCAPGTPPAGQPDQITVVASTDVYGDLAAAVGGDLVSVTSIIESAAQDPHSYEASARDQLSVARAQLIVMNGGGYDSFMNTLLAAAATGLGAAVVEAVLLADHGDDAGTAADDHADPDDDHGDEHADDGDDHAADDHGHVHSDLDPDFNEHVWYDLHIVGHVVEAIAAELSRIDPANAATFEANADELLTGLADLEARATALVPLAAGRGVAVTEPVPLYLLEATGLRNVSPAAFTEAIEEGGDVPPLALQQLLEVLTGGDVALLAYNDQTASPETERVRTAAEQAGIPVVSFTETLPDGETYLTWMAGNLDRIEAALR